MNFELGDNDQLSIVTLRYSIEFNTLKIKVFKSRIKNIISG